MKFDKIKNIQINNDNKLKNTIYLTFDIDWASDAILSHTLDIIEKNDISATFFTTHNTILNKRIMENPKIELGIHPNFNYILNGDFKYGSTYREIIKYYRKIVPEAISIRSHSLVQSSLLLDEFALYDYKYDCNVFIPYYSNIVLKPWKNWNESLIRVPFYWEDDLHFMQGADLSKMNIDSLMKREGLKVFNIHPIHIYLNSNNMGLYVNNRKYHQNHEMLYKLRNKNYGVESFLINLIRKVVNSQ